MIGAMITTASAILNASVGISDTTAPEIFSLEARDIFVHYNLFCMCYSTCLSSNIPNLIIINIKCRVNHGIFSPFLILSLFTKVFLYVQNLNLPTKFHLSWYSGYFSLWLHPFLPTILLLLRFSRYFPLRSHLFLPTILLLSRFSRYFHLRSHLFLPTILLLSRFSRYFHLKSHAFLPTILLLSRFSRYFPLRSHLFLPTILLLSWFNGYYFLGRIHLKNSNFDLNYSIMSNTNAKREFILWFLLYNECDQHT